MRNAKQLLDEGIAADQVGLDARRAWFTSLTDEERETFDLILVQSTTAAIQAANIGQQWLDDPDFDLKQAVIAMEAQRPPELSGALAAVREKRAEKEDSNAESTTTPE